MWYRGYLRDSEEVACKKLAETLQILQAKRMVVGHTTQRTGQIATRCNGALVGIDTGISEHYGKNISALELINDDARAIYKGSTVDLPDPN